MTPGNGGGIVLAVKAKPIAELSPNGTVLYATDHSGDLCEDHTCAAKGPRTCRYKLEGDKAGQLCGRRYCYSADDAHGDAKHCQPHARLVASR